MLNVGDSFLLLRELLHLVFEPLVHLLSPGLFESELLLKLLNQPFLLLERLTDHRVDFMLSLSVRNNAINRIVSFFFILGVQVAQMRCLASPSARWVVH